MFIRKYWLPLSVFIVAITGVGLYLLAMQPPKEPVEIYKAVEPIEKPPQQPTAKVPVGDTSQGGHFHADGTWHEGSHEVHAPAQPVEASEVEAERTEVPGTPVVAQPIDAQIIEQAAQNGNIRLFDKRTSEYYEAVAAWKEWNKKFDELHVLDMEAGQMLIDALPTKEEAKQYDNDKQFKKEVNRKAREALDKSFEIGAMIRAHEAKKPPFPYIR